MLINFENVITLSHRFFAIHHEKNVLRYISCYKTNYFTKYSYLGYPDAHINASNLRYGVFLYTFLIHIIVYF